MALHGFSKWNRERASSRLRYGVCNCEYRCASLLLSLLLLGRGLIVSEGREPVRVDESAEGTESSVNGLVIDGADTGHPMLRALYDDHPGREATVAELAFWKEVERLREAATAANDAMRLYSWGGISWPELDRTFAALEAALRSTEEER